MSVPSKIQDQTDAFLKAYARIDVDYMCFSVFGSWYDEIKGLIYPAPAYKTFIINKRNGEPRILQEPRQKLKDLQLKLLDHLYAEAGEAKPCVHGFTPGRSIVTNARSHCSDKTRFVLNIDIEDFFPSITFFRVRGMFRKPPFSYSHEVATVLAQMCTYQGVLPQGAPTSPLIANLICRTLDGELTQLARQCRATYTRYADDITFSFSVKSEFRLPQKICTFDGSELTLGEELRNIFEENSFKLNEGKSRISGRNNRLAVTGLTINEFPNVRRVFIDKVRGALHAWDKYGFKRAQETWETKVKSGTALEYEKRVWTRQTREKFIPQLQNVLFGKLLFLRMVRGADDPIYKRLAEKYNELCMVEDIENHGFSYVRAPVDNVVVNEDDAEDAVFVLEWMADYVDPKTHESDMVGGQGTAFVYRDVGLISCDHVLRYEGECFTPPRLIRTNVLSTEIRSLSISLKNPRSGEEWAGHVVRMDPDLDLALLRFGDEAPTPRRYFAPLPKTPNIKSVGILIGFPNHTTDKRPNFVNSEVLNVYEIKDRTYIEISENIRQGNSGGPYVDENYRLAGVAQQGSKQDSGNDACLCVTELEQWLSISPSAPVSAEPSI
ncbi:MAG: trypsin-like peptidase domain-containing protein [Rhodocyclaceae bacterium]|nr:trypsin-like peptidase domain-containing protein [Rhodocyclaceae bacterium]